MAVAVIRHQIALVIRLMDTTTGDAVPETRVQMFRDGKPVKPLPKGDGIYVLLDEERKDFCLRVNIYGYEDESLQVQYSELDSKMPITEVFLMPKEGLTAGEDILTLRGCLPGIEGIEAVSLKENDCFIRDFDRQEQILYLYNPHARKIKDVHYGILNAERQAYEHIRVVQEISDYNVKIGAVLQEPYKLNCPIMRIVFGRTGADGSYMLRVRDDAKELLYLVKYWIKGKEKYQTVDFHQMKPLKS